MVRGKNGGDVARPPRGVVSVGVETCLRKKPFEPFTMGLKSEYQRTDGLRRIGPPDAYPCGRSI